MEVQLTPEQERQLSHLASDQGRTTATLANEVLVQYLESESHFAAAVELGDQALDRGDYLTHEQVGANLQKLFNS